MKFPKPDLQEYAKSTAILLLIWAAFQYTGIFFENAGAINWRSLLILGMSFPIFAYILAIITENVEWLPYYDKMNRTRKEQ